MTKKTDERSSSESVRKSANELATQHDDTPIPMTTKIETKRRIYEGELVSARIRATQKRIKGGRKVDTRSTIEHLPN